MELAIAATWIIGAAAFLAVALLARRRAPAAGPLLTAAAAAVAALPPALSVGAALHLDRNATEARAAEFDRRVAELRSHGRSMGFDQLAAACARAVLASEGEEGATTMSQLRRRCDVDAEAIVREHMARNT